MMGEWFYATRRMPEQAIEPDYWFFTIFILCMFVYVLVSMYTLKR